MRAFQLLAVVTLSAITSMSNAATFSQGEICRAMVSATMFHDVSIIKIDKQSQGVTHLSYNRPSDNSRWAMRCKIEGDRIIWATETGRWRTHELDEVITYEISGDELKIHQKFGDGSSSEDVYLREQF